MGMNYLEAFDASHLHDIIDSNDSAPDFSRDAVDRLVKIAQQRADARGEMNALSETQTDCLILTTWRDFGNGQLDGCAIGVLEEEISDGKGATLFTDAVAVNQQWVRNADGRVTKLTPYNDKEFEKSDEGDCWIPNGAQEYMCIVELSDELIHGEITLEDAL